METQPRKEDHVAVDYGKKGDAPATATYQKNEKSNRAKQQGGDAGIKAAESRTGGQAAAGSGAKHPAAAHEKDHALVLDLMEFFCYAVKPDPSFFGTITFVFDQETGEGSKIDARGDKPELEVSVTIQKGVDVVIPGRDEPRPRVVVALGTPPAGAEPSKGRVRVPYEQFLLIYSGKASATDVARLAMNPKVELTGFASFMKFGVSFDYSVSSWKGYYETKRLCEEEKREAEKSAGKKHHHELSPSQAPTIHEEDGQHLYVRGGEESINSHRVMLASQTKSPTAWSEVGLLMHEGAHATKRRGGSSDDDGDDRSRDESGSTPVDCRILFSSDAFRIAAELRAERARKHAGESNSDGDDDDDDDDERDSERGGAGGGGGGQGGATVAAKRGFERRIKSWVRWPWWVGGKRAGNGTFRHKDGAQGEIRGAITSRDLVEVAGVLTSVLERDGGRWLEPAWIFAFLLKRWGGYLSPVVGMEAGEVLYGGTEEGGETRQLQPGVSHFSRRFGSELGLTRPLQGTFSLRTMGWPSSGDSCGLESSLFSSALRPTLRWESDPRWEPEKQNYLLRRLRKNGRLFIGLLTSSPQYDYRRTAPKTASAAHAHTNCGFDGKKLDASVAAAVPGIAEVGVAAAVVGTPIFAVNAEHKPRYRRVFWSASGGVGSGGGAVALRAARALLIGGGIAFFNTPAGRPGIGQLRRRDGGIPKEIP